MKAITLKAFGSTDNFKLENLTVPKPKGDEILIRLKATAFNPIDYQMRLGRRESELMNSPVLGRELAGIVEEIGEGVKNFKPGDEIYAASGSSGSNGSYAQYMALTEKKAALKPKSLSFEQATAIPSAGLTAWQTFNRLNVKPNESIFITGGSGAVGSFLIKLLKSSNIHQIITIAGNIESTDAIKAMGLNDDQVLDYKKPDLEKRILDANKQQHFDYVVDIVGDESSEIAAAVLKVNGVYADITFLSTQKTRELLFDKGASILNISNYSFTLKNNLEWYGETLNELKKLIEGNKLDTAAINIVGHFSLNTVKQAHNLMENNLTKGKKLVMTID
ncbi:quinone oxidoreductase family protein [Pedobacter punctiformis]|uniref:NADP-dependent oxidoreductase n=1 Tax=Pedobacter punctiformis TaxID=3004097 RepID=A0ABT4L9C5_9SPHI|nr:NADP-dependent oxidoreductase [Pedobacter sp. HCMS5-2]MCZ4244522.1 NADP-dependent oxidoreductase [Pedobacter sp. HCMS5-2]